MNDNALQRVDMQLFLGKKHIFIRIYLFIYRAREREGGIDKHTCSKIAMMITPWSCDDPFLLRWLGRKILEGYSHLGHLDGEQPHLGDVFPMVTNHLLTGKVLQVLIWIAFFRVCLFVIKLALKDHDGLKLKLYSQ